MYKVQFKSHNAHQVWANHGNYGDEMSALSNAARIASRYFMVRVLDPHGNTVWTA